METVPCLKRSMFAFLGACLGMGVSLCVLHDASLVPMAENALPSLAGPGKQPTLQTSYLLWPHKLR